MRFAENNTSVLPANGQGDPARVGRFAVYESKIAFFDLSLLHGGGKTVGGDGVLCDEDSTARFSVKACDGAEHKGAVAISEC